MSRHFKITENNVNRFVKRLKTIYPCEDVNHIREYFGEGTGKDWKFRQDWFENEYKSFDELLAEIGYWLYVQY